MWSALHHGRGLTQRTTQCLLDTYEAAPLGWDATDPGPVADSVCFLLSDLGRTISGEALHVAWRLPRARGARGAGWQ